jgi:hypothetical protein
MAINDFAGPIIQAFMAGQQMKRQREQDVLAQQERERMVKEAERQVKRQEQQDKIEASVRRMTMENMLRGEMAAGTRNIPIVDMPAPGGVAAPQVSPVAQQLMAPSAVQELPLQQVPGVQAPMQLGQEFAIPETQRVQQNILNIPEIGQFDLRQFPSYEDTMQRKMIERAMLGQADITLAGQKAAVEAAAKLPAQKELEQVKGASRVEAAKVAADVRREVAEGRRALEDKRFEQLVKNQNEMTSIARARLNQALAQASTTKADTVSAKLQSEKEILDSALEVAREGNVSREELLSDVPIQLRAKTLAALQAEKVPVLTKKQIEGKAEFAAARNLLEEVIALNNQINADGMLAGMPLSKSSAMFEEVKAKTEGLARDFLQMRGVLSNADIERAFGVIVKPTIFKESTTNPRRIETLIKDIGTKFKAAYGSLPKEKQLQIMRDTGLLKYLAKEVK